MPNRKVFVKEKTDDDWNSSNFDLNLFDFISSILRLTACKLNVLSFIVLFFILFFWHIVYLSTLLLLLFWLRWFMKFISDRSEKETRTIYHETKSLTTVAEKGWRSWYQSFQFFKSSVSFISEKINFVRRTGLDWLPHDNLKAAIAKHLFNNLHTNCQGYILLLTEDFCPFISVLTSLKR